MTRVFLRPRTSRPDTLRGRGQRARRAARRGALTLALLTAAVCGTACGSPESGTSAPLPPPPSNPPVPAEHIRPEAPAASFLEALARNRPLGLLEGLPHQTFEPELLASEKKAKQTVARDGFPFYAEPLALADADAARIRALLSAPDSLKPWSGPKKCGGFHPDYLVTTTVAGTEWRAHLCFGCFEVKTAGAAETHQDMTQETRSALMETLSRYRKNRPAER